MIEIKTQADIVAMRRAGKISANALHLAGSLIKPGACTLDIDKEVEKYIRSTGATPSFKGYGGFPASACISVNDTVIHGIPGKSIILKESDIVSVDVGAYIGGFHGDNAYTFACGAISEQAQKLLDVTEESLYKAIEKAVPGNRVGDISNAVQSYVEGFGYSVVRDYTGHGVGKKLHEDPQIPNYGKAGHGPRLAPGMVLAIEPMINQFGYNVKLLSDEWTVKTVDGGLSAHFEHSIVITEDGAEILTLADGE